MRTSVLLLLGGTQLASAHFGLSYPSWRADTLKDTNVTGYNQRNYPCASPPQPASPALTLI